MLFETPPEKIHFAFDADAVEKAAHASDAGEMDTGRDVLDGIALGSLRDDL